MHRLLQEIETVQNVRFFGKVSCVVGSLIEAEGLHQHTSVGSLCEIYPKKCSNVPSLLAEVVGFRGESILLMPYATPEGIGPGCRIDFVSPQPFLFPHTRWLGRVLSGLGEPIDGKGQLQRGALSYKTRASPVPAHLRGLVRDRLDLGVRAINSFLTCCQGQRMGIFAGSGVGKSVLLSQIARFTQADVVVIGLIGERGREVREFLDEHLGEEGMRKCVVVVATSDEPAPMRRQAAYVTMTIADYFRDQGQQVLCLMDSVTRFAMALREIGLAAGEPPASKGYTPSVFAELPRLLERAGPGIASQGNGTTTGLFTVLVDGDDHNEPIADAVRGILDGHIVLDRAIAQRGRFPAIDILKSVSRMVPKCHSQDERAVVKRARELLGAYEEMADMIRLGAYKKGTSPEVDEAIIFYKQLEGFLVQDQDEQSSLEDTFETLMLILERGGAKAA